MTTSFGLEASHYAFDWPYSSIITNGIKRTHSGVFWNNNNDETITTIMIMIMMMVMMMMTMTMMMMITTKNGGHPCQKKSFYWKRKITGLFNVLRWKMKTLKHCDLLFRRIPNSLSYLWHWDTPIKTRAENRRRQNFGQYWRVLQEIPWQTPKYSSLQYCWRGTLLRKQNNRFFYIRTE